MKYLIFIITALHSFAMLSADDKSRDMFNGAAIAAKFQCSNKLNDYKFEDEYENIFKFSSRGKIDQNKILEVSRVVYDDMKKTCKDKKYLAGGWDLQKCFNTCQSVFKNDNISAERCVSTCSSLNEKIISVIYDFGSAINEGLITSGDNCKKDKIKIVNDSSRGHIKEKESSNSLNVPLSSTSAISK